MHMPTGVANVCMWPQKCIVVSESQTNCPEW